MDISELPECCIAHVLSLTSPRDSCRAALVSAAFRSAAESDTVWDRFLPPDHRQILSMAVHPPPAFSSKKELYFRLCDSILIDGGDISFGLEKLSGKKHFMISARGLAIAWGDTPRYWRWNSESSSRFAEVAELIAVCWLEIQGSINARFLSPKTTYRAYLIFRTVPGSYGLTFPAQEATIKVGADVSKSSVCLQPDDSDPPQRRLTILGRSVVFRAPPLAAGGIDGQVHTPREREDGWMELEMGKFFVDDGNEGRVDIGLIEVKGGQWKRGLIIQGIEIKPEKQLKEFYVI